LDLLTEKYLFQKECWPVKGKHVLAQFTKDYVVVYQAYRPAIGHYAVEHQYFGGEFSYSRMSWIKPNFLWMMYRSGWAEKEGQELVLAIFLKRHYFDEILSNACPSTNLLNVSDEEWRSKIVNSNVRLQWDPDHAPSGQPVTRKAIQLGLRKEFLAPFKGEGILRIMDITDFVGQQRLILESGEIDELETPLEKSYPVSAKIKHVLCMT